MTHNITESMSTHTLDDYAARAKAMGDDELDATLAVMREAASYTGTWGLNRLAVLNAEIDRRRKFRRGKEVAA